MYSYLSLILSEEGLNSFSLDGDEVGLELLKHVDDLELFEHRHVDAFVDVFLGKDTGTLNYTRNKKVWLRDATFLESRYR